MRNIWELVGACVSCFFVTLAATGQPTDVHERVYLAFDEFERAEFIFSGTISEIAPLKHPSSQEVCGWSISLEGQRLDGVPASKYNTNVVILDVGTLPEESPFAIGERVVVSGFFGDSPDVELMRSALRSQRIMYCDLVTYETGQDLATYVSTIENIDGLTDVAVVAIPASQMSLEMSEYIVGWRDHQAQTFLCPQSLPCSDKKHDARRGVFEDSVYYIDITSLARSLR